MKRARRKAAPAASDAKEIDDDQVEDEDAEGAEEPELKALPAVSATFGVEIEAGYWSVLRLDGTGAEASVREADADSAGRPP